MLIRSLVTILIVVSASVFVSSQTPEYVRDGSDKAAKPVDAQRIEKIRDLPFAGGVDLQFLIKELARQMDVNVLFDTESFRGGGRKTYIALKNVTAKEALDYLLLQEQLIYDDIGPRTIMVAHRSRGTSVPQIGIGITYLTEQLAQYFGADGGMLINSVRPDSSGRKAGLRAGDVIVSIDADPVRGALGLMRAIDAKKDGDITLKIVRDRKEQTITVTRPNGIE